MSCHDGYDRPLMEGRAVVNPLLEQRKRLTKLEKLLQEIANETENDQLKTKIEQTLKN